jgi:hypothetical protein
MDVTKSHTMKSHTIGWIFAPANNGQCGAAESSLIKVNATSIKG